MMNALIQQLLTEETGGTKPTLVVCTKTRIDTGRWWWPTPIWLCVMPEELLMLAVSRRRYVARVPLASCAETYYCHATGDLVLAPVEGLLYSGFRVTPKQALLVLSAMGLPQWDLEGVQEAGNRIAPVTTAYEDTLEPSQEVPVTTEQTVPDTL